VTKNYALDVQRVLKEVDVIQSETTADIALISATAKREAQVTSPMISPMISPVISPVISPCPASCRGSNSPDACWAGRSAQVIVNKADADALKLEQSTKATWYSKLKAHMKWDNAHFLQYVKIKSLSEQPSESMRVGVKPMGETSTTAAG